MKKVFLSVIGFTLICRMSAYSQVKTDSAGAKPKISLYAPDSSTMKSNYKDRSLHVDEINFVSSYYWQTGDHSAVTGGIGSEKVTDIANGLDIKLAWLNSSLNKNTLSIGLGFDHHTSASQAFVSATGASKTGGDRIYPSIDWTKENAKNGNTFGLGAYVSSEYNYQSLGGDLHFSLKTQDKMGEFGVKLQAYLDKVKLIYPSELIPGTTTTTSGGTTIITTASGTTTTLSDGEHGHRGNIPSSPRNTFSSSFSYSQIINSRLQIMFLADLVEQHGYLSLPFHRVYFSTGKDTVEKLPAQRFKLPIGFRANYFLGDNIILRSYYRYYMDNWGIKSNTANLEVVYKVSPFFSIAPFYRFYSQSAAKYFAPYEAHNINDAYYTSNYEYSKFNSNFFGVGFRIAPPAGVFGMQGLHDLEIRYGHYAQNTDLVSNVVSLSLGFK